MESKSLGVGYYRVNTAEVVAKRVSSTLGTPETVRLCSQKLSPRVCSMISCCSRSNSRKKKKDHEFIDS